MSSIIRAGVFIGVDRSGTLPVLRDAAAGARRMHAWAVSQGMVDGAQARLITDEGGRRVRPDEIADAVEAILEAGVDQLVLYFAGHGVNLNRGEQWLLTEAPARTGAAVNVAGSVELARYSGIGHVVVISDACRVAPDGIQAQNVRGVDVFPNDAVADRAKPVDQFFACALGRTAAELRDPADAAKGFSALYTGALLDALNGKRPDLLERDADAAAGWCYVRPRALQRYLEDEVPRRVRALNLEGRVRQDPDAIITSDGSWISRLTAIAQQERRARKSRDVTRGERVWGGEPVASGRISWIELQQLDGSLGPRRGPNSDPSDRLHEALRLTLAYPAFPFVGAAALLLERASPASDAPAVPSRCGIRVRGGRIDGFAAGPHIAVNALGNEGALLDVTLGENRAASVVVRLSGGLGTVVPALHGFVATLTVDGDELTDLTYEPATGSSRHDAFRTHATELRSLRTIAAEASLEGRFRIEPGAANDVARAARRSGFVDPTLALYAAYGFHDTQQIDRIDELARDLHRELGVALFDVELLRRAFLTPRPERVLVVPALPLLSRGWALLRANRVALPWSLQGIEDTLRDSLWSLYDARGVEMLMNAVRSGEVR